VLWLFRIITIATRASSLVSEMGNTKPTVHAAWGNQPWNECLWGLPFFGVHDYSVKLGDFMDGGSSRNGKNRTLRQWHCCKVSPAAILA
jgi:hypothetical protein